jgi:hypothetical protein
MLIIDSKIPLWEGEHTAEVLAELEAGGKARS